MKKVVIAIALMLATSASWAGGSLASAAATFSTKYVYNGSEYETREAWDAARGTLRSTSVGINASSDMYKGYAKNATGSTITAYIVELGTGGDFLDAYKNGTLVINNTDRVWQVKGDSSYTTYGNAYAIDLTISTTYGRTDAISNQGVDASGRSIDVRNAGLYALVIIAGDAFDGNPAKQPAADGKDAIYIGRTIAVGSGSLQWGDSKFGSGANSTPSATATELFGTSSTSSSAYGWAAGEGNSYLVGSAIVVPEPTSGLMILIGIASLALKRKRA